jgi:predicted secreted Zn-dependent protease
MPAAKGTILQSAISKRRKIKLIYSTMPRYKIKVKSSESVAQVWVPVSAISKEEAQRISLARCSGRGFSPDLKTLIQISEEDYQKLAGKVQNA